MTVCGIEALQYRCFPDLFQFRRSLWEIQLFPIVLISKSHYPGDVMCVLHHMLYPLCKREHYIACTVYELCSEQGPAPVILCRCAVLCWGPKISLIFIRNCLLVVLCIISWPHDEQLLGLGNRCQCLKNPCIVFLYVSEETAFKLLCYSSVHLMVSRGSTRCHKASRPAPCRRQLLQWNIMVLACATLAGSVEVALQLESTECNSRVPNSAYLNAMNSYR